MKFRIRYLWFMVPLSFLFLFFTKVPTQGGSFSSESTRSFSEKGLFDTDLVFQITLKGNIRELLNDRTQDPKLFPLILSYKKEDSSESLIPVKVKTRGHFRRLKENCDYPPLMIQFPKQGPKLLTVFRGQQKLKLVMPCIGDECVIREWLAYKMYNLVTPYSFKVRLVKIKLEDDRNKRSVATFYGILLEEEKQMAKRNHAVIIDKKLQPKQIKTDAFFKMSVFQYLIGNTDWSIQYQQNIKLVSVDSVAAPIAVPYDFDHSGLVNAPYAVPAEELLLSSIRQRRFRGYCVQDLNMYNDVLAEYNRLKNDVYSLFTSCAFLDQKYLKSTLQWLDDFFKTINNTKAWQKDFAYPCDKNGTGNVVIKGLKED